MNEIKTWLSRSATGLALVLAATVAPIVVSGQDASDALVQTGYASEKAAPLGGKAPRKGATNARLRQPRERMAVAEAIWGAARRLALARCLGLLDEFVDASREPLRAVLTAQEMDAGEYLDRMFFYDANPSDCEGTMLAGATGPGSRVIRVCGRRFARTMAESSSQGEALIIHEMLHSLGLGENPPTSRYITSRILDECRQ